MTASKCVFAATLCALACLMVTANIDEFPQNTDARVGDTVHLKCSFLSMVNARPAWSEFAYSPGGGAISDGRQIYNGSPLNGRVTIIGTDPEFTLEIRNVALTDGGTYVCQDMGATTGVFRGFAQLSVRDGDPICQEFSNPPAHLIENNFYLAECILDYKGNLRMSMLWTFNDVFQGNFSDTGNQMLAFASLTATRSMSGKSFELVTKYDTVVSGNPETAGNTPTYQHLSTWLPFNVTWPPIVNTTTITPVKATYVVGDVLTCATDSNPASTFLFQNMRTLASYPGSTFTITADMEGFFQQMRCNAQLTLANINYTANVFLDVDVPTVTTTPAPTPPPTTTTPAANGPCNDLTGRWRSSNPNADLCVEINTNGDVITLIRNGSETQFVQGVGKSIYGEYKHMSFAGLWPVPNGACGFAGECHSCYGSESLILSGLRRNFYLPSECGTSAGTDVTKLYVFTRSGPPCRGLELDIYNPNPQILEAMGVKARNAQPI